jgi:hypothetical protein
MTADGTIDPAASRSLPPVPARAVFLTPEQTARAAAYLHANWPKAAG